MKDYTVLFKVKYKGKIYPQSTYVRDANNELDAENIVRKLLSEDKNIKIKKLLEIKEVSITGCHDS